MSNTFTKTSLRGFTLIELLVVIAIIGLLSTAIMGPVQTGLKKGRDTRKISDISQIQGALLQYAGDNAGKYPALLTDLAPTYMSSDTNMLTGAVSRNKFMYVIYRDATPETNIVQYHIGVALENQNASLQSDVDCGDWTNGTTNTVDETSVIATGTLPCTQGLKSGNTWGTLTNTNYAASGAGNPAASASSTDFGGFGSQEASSTGVCTTDLKTCIFDVIPK